MNVLKENKKTNLIEEQVAGTVLVVALRKGEFKGQKLVHVTVQHPEGQITNHTVSETNGANLRAGYATMLQQQWSAKSKFGASVGTVLNNIEQFSMKPAGAPTI